MTPGQIAFEAFDSEYDSVTWHDLSAETRNKWEAAAEAVRNPIEQCIQGLLFDLMRDKLPAGQVAKFVENAEKYPPPYSFGDLFASHMADAALSLAKRLCAVKLTGMVSEDG